MFKPEISKIVNFNILIAIFFLFLLLVVHKRLVFGSEAGMVYHYVNDFTARPVVIFFSILPIMLLSVYLTHKYIHKNEFLIICLWFIAGFVFQITINSPYVHSFENIIKSDMANSFYSPTLKYNIKEFISTFNSIRNALPLHAKSNMPGKVLFFYFLEIFTSSPKIMGYLIILFSNIGAILSYFICKILFKDKLIAIDSLILYFFIPAKIYLFPILNTITPVFILLSFLILLHYLESHKDIYLLLFGVSLYVVSFFEPTPLILGIIFIAFLWKYYFEKKISRADIFIIGYYSLISFLFVHIIFYYALTFNIFDTFLIIFKDAATFNVEAHRSYHVWVVQNLKEFFINAGFLQSMLFFIFSFYILYKVITIFRNEIAWRTNILKFISESGILLTASFIIVLLFIDLLGINRGEVLRLWIFLTIFIQIIASYVCSTKLNKTAFYIVLTSTLLQTIITISMVGFIIP